MPGEQGTHTREATIGSSIFDARNYIKGEIFKIGCNSGGIEIPYIFHDGSLSGT